jgi:hypothetical protein
VHTFTNAEGTNLGIAIPYSQQTHDAAINNIDFNEVVSLGFIPKATVANIGTNTESFNVTLSIGSWTSVKSVTSLVPSAAQQVVFDACPLSAGEYPVSVCTQLGTDMRTSNDCKSLSLKILNLNKKIYAYQHRPYYGTFPNSTISFFLNNTESLTMLENQEEMDWIFGGTWAKGRWFASVWNEFSSYQLIRVDTTIGSRTAIGNIGFRMSEISYNPADNKMYGINYDYATLSTSLYSIDTVTGAATLAGTPNPGLELDGLAIDNAGNAFSIDVNSDQLGHIDLSTGIWSSIGYIGFDAGNPNIEFDRQTEKLYMSASNLSISRTKNELRLVDTAKGMTNLIGNLGTFGALGDWSLIYGLAIPYNADKTLNLSVFLEGLYNGSGTMRKAQDASGDHFTSNVADKISIELHDASNYSNIEYSVSNVNLKTDGTVALAVPVIHNASYYLTIKHRNSIETTTATPVSFSGGTISYTFDAPAKAYGGNLLLMSDGRCAIYSGDVNQDGIIDSGDIVPVDNLMSTSGTGYIPEDINGDGVMDLADMTIIYNNASVFVSVITP